MQSNAKSLSEKERLIEASRARPEGERGYTVDEFQKNMREAIAKGAKSNSITEDSFDYTQWRQGLYKDVPLDTFLSDAQKHRDAIEA